jgi:hypothetical protein
MQDTSHLHITFYIDTIEDPAATAREGVPKFKDVEMVKIMFAGDRNSVLVAPASDTSFCPELREQIAYREQFPRHYAAFKEQRELHADGTPIDQLPGITGSRVAEFKAQKVFTVEALAAIDGTALGKLGMGAREWKMKAQSWLDKAREGAIDSKLAAQNEALQAQLAAMAETIKALQKAGSPKAEDEDDGKIEVVTEGPFAGNTAEDLKRYIQIQTGKGVKGRPGLATLKTMAEELAAAAEASA